MNDKTKLQELAKQRLEEQTADSFFDYHNWDDLIEVEEEITEEDLKWMSENLKFKIEVVSDEDEN